MSFIRKNWKIITAVAVLGLLKTVWRQSRSVDLQGAVVFITGGSRGLGLALAQEYQRAGTRLVISARDTQELQRAAEQLRGQGAEVLTIPCDVSRPEEVQHAIEQATAHFGQIDVLVNNAGIISAGAWQTLTREDFETSMNTMFWGIYNTTMAVLPQMRERHNGHIVNITSVGGKVSVPHLLAYSSAKFAAVGFSEGLHSELAQDGIRVLTVAPGLMRTGSQVNAIIKGEMHRQEYALFTLLDTSPLASISVQRAARQIVTATRQGRAELIISIQAQILARFHGAFPELSSELLALADRLLPTSRNTGTTAYSGRESETQLTRSAITQLGQEASHNYNENE